MTFSMRGILTSPIHQVDWTVSMCSGAMALLLGVNLRTQGLLCSLVSRCVREISPQGLFVSFVSARWQWLVSTGRYASRAAGRPIGSINKIAILGVILADRRHAQGP